MCLTEQIELGGCVLKGWAPGGLNNDSQLALAHSVWKHKAGDVSLGKKKKSSIQTRAHRCLRCMPWASVISRPHCFWTIATNLPSGLDRLCWAGRGVIVQLWIVSPLRQRPVDADKWGDNGSHLSVTLLVRLFIGLAENVRYVNSMSNTQRHQLIVTLPHSFLDFYFKSPPTWVMSSESPAVKCRLVETWVIRF